MSFLPVADDYVQKHDTAGLVDPRALLTNGKPPEKKPWFAYQKRTRRFQISSSILQEPQINILYARNAALGIEGAVLILASVFLPLNRRG